MFSGGAVASARGSGAGMCRARAAPDKVVRLDARLAGLVRGESGTRLVLGELLEALAQRDGHHELGFSSLGAGAASVRVDLRVTRDTARFWRALAGVTHKHLSRDTTFARLLCDTFWKAWRHLTERNEAYAHIYARDRYTCSSPVCSRHDVTPHHVTFRSQGGSDQDENVISLCTWCHLEGVHGGRLEVTGSAGNLRWELGRPTLRG